MIGNTLDHLAVQDIKEDLVLLKDGGVSMVLQTSAVNFDLLSEREQLAIIDGFAAMLNSLSFPIEIVIRSKRLNISNYLELLSNAEKKQNNPLLKHMMQQYRAFVAALIRENEVLDKKFYVVIPVSYLELGVVNDSQKHLQKAATILIPRKDHIIKLMARIGLRANSLDTPKLIKLFYDYYNEGMEEAVQYQQTENPNLKELTPQPVQQPPIPTNTPPVIPPQPTVRIPQPSPVITHPLNTPQPQRPNPAGFVQPQIPSTYIPPQPKAQPTYAPQKTTNERRVPFVVEELPDDYGSI